MTNNAEILFFRDLLRHKPAAEDQQMKDCWKILFGTDCNWSNLRRAREDIGKSSRIRISDSKKDYIVAMLTVDPDLQTSLVVRRINYVFGEGVRRDIVDELRYSGNPMTMTQAKAIIAGLNIRQSEGKPLL